jgi:acyl carrier protein phosphodiesterase
MTNPNDLQFAHGHPMPTDDHAALIAAHHLLLNLADECVPVQIAPRGQSSFFEDWEVTRAAFIARMSGTLRHLGYLAPSYSRLDGFALTRTLVDHVITFAWTSADPNERLPAFLRSSLRNLLRKDARSRSRGAGALIEDAQRERLTAFIDRIDQDIPGLRDRSSKADAHWVLQARLRLPKSLQILDFQRLYRDVYDHYSAYDHPTTTGLQVWVHLAGSPVVATVDGEPERNLVEDLRPYWIAVFAFAEALVVSNLASGRPRLQRLNQALKTIGSMRELEREGRLTVTARDDGTMSIGVAGDHEGADAAPT